MARDFDGIKEIDGTHETLRLAVRITDLWVVSSQQNYGVLEMVIMDAKVKFIEGDKIQAIARKDQFVKWQPLLVEGSSYVMNNFKIIPNEGQFRTCDHSFKLLFSGGTTLKEEELSHIPLNVYRFKDFSEIISGEYKRDLFVDIIGAIEKITFQGITNGKRKIAFNLKDVSGNLLNCTLWEDYAVKLINYFNGKNVEELIVIVLTNAKIRDAQGAFAVGVSNSYYCSKLHINAEIEEVLSFKNQFDIAGLSQMDTQSFNMSQFTSSSQISGASQFSEDEKFLYKAAVKTLSEINEIKQDIQCVTVATIGKINTSSNGWYYEGCSGCTKTAGPTKSDFTCSCGQYNETAKTRYRVEIEVYHNKFSSKFVFWDRECEHFIGMTAIELRHLMIKELGYDDPKQYPKPLDQMLGHTMAFRVKLQSRFNNSAVLRMSDDPKFIQIVLDQMRNVEGTSGSGKSMSGVNVSSLNEMGTCDSSKANTTANQDSQSEVSAKSLDFINLDSQNEVTFENVKTVAAACPLSQSDVQTISATADHDPEMLNVVTPAKRQPSQLVDDQVLSQSLSPAQLSTTKLSKQIKTE